METGDVIDMEMAEEEIDRFLLRDVPVGLGNPVAGIENDIIFACLDEYGDRVAGEGIEPSIGAKEGDLHVEKVWAFFIKKGALRFSIWVLIAIKFFAL
jgi:hypothetical protein